MRWGWIFHLCQTERNKSQLSGFPIMWCIIFAQNLVHNFQSGNTRWVYENAGNLQRRNYYCRREASELWAYVTKIAQDAAWCELNISAAQEPRNLSNLANFPVTVGKQIWGANFNYEVQLLTFARNYLKCDGSKTWFQTKSIQAIKYMLIGLVSNVWSRRQYNFKAQFIIKSEWFIL